MRHHHFDIDLDKLAGAHIYKPKHQGFTVLIRRNNRIVTEFYNRRRTRKTRENQAGDKRVHQQTVIRFNHHEKIRYKSDRMNRAVTDRCKSLDAEEKRAQKLRIQRNARTVNQRVGAAERVKQTEKNVAEKYKTKTIPRNFVQDIESETWKNSTTKRKPNPFAGR